MTAERPVLSDPTLTEYTLIRDEDVLTAMLASRSESLPDQEKFLDAINFAKEAHDGVPRRSGDKYITHPLRVTAAVLSSGVTNIDDLCISILHDVAEDTDKSLDDIEQRFGKTVRDGVDLLSKKEHATGKEKNLDEYFRALLHGPDNIKRIKVLDRIDNLYDLEGATDTEKRHKINQTRQFISPLAEFDPELLTKLNKAIQELEESFTRSRVLADITDLERRNPSIVLWGKVGGSKSIDFLKQEIEDGESRLVLDESGEVIIELFAIGANVTYTSPEGKRYVLREDRQEFRDGRIRKREMLPRSLGEKIRPDELPIAAARRLLREELDIEGDIDLLAQEPEEVLEESGFYPGLISFKNIFPYDVILSPDQFKPEGYIEDQPDKGKAVFFVWEEIDPKPDDHPLDMRSTIEWYGSKADELIDMLPNKESALTLPIEESTRYSISESEMSALISLYPGSATDRSTIFIIRGMPTLYFDKNSTPGNIIPTDKAEDAISPTAFAPSYTDYKKDEAGDILTTVELYEIPGEVDPRVKRIIHAQGLVHEYAHSIITPILYSSSYKLRLTSGEVIEGKELIERFALIEEALSTFSHYSEEYRKNNKTFSESENRKQALNEELSEAIAALLLGFVYCEEEDRRLDPFKDRPEVRQFVVDFLNAEKIE